MIYRDADGFRPDRSGRPVPDLAAEPDDADPVVADQAHASPGSGAGDRPRS